MPESMLTATQAELANVAAKALIERKELTPSDTVAILAGALAVVIATGQKNDNNPIDAVRAISAATALSLQVWSEITGVDCTAALQKLYMPKEPF